jgi:hypothetical protein
MNKNKYMLAKAIKLLNEYYDDDEYNAWKEGMTMKKTNPCENCLCHTCKYKQSQLCTDNMCRDCINFTFVSATTYCPTYKQINRRDNDDI